MLRLSYVRILLRMSRWQLLTRRQVEQDAAKYVLREDPLRKPTSKWDDNIKIDLKEIG